MKRNHPFKARVTIMLAIIFILSLITFSQKASSINNYPDIDVTVSPSEIKAGINEEFTLTYHFEPKPIPAKLINPTTDKEIVLVIDTSGSMRDNLNDGQTRMAAVKTAAKNFVNKFNFDENTKIGIVTYNSRGQIDNYLTSMKDSGGLINTLESLRANGGTNIGDGIRIALGALQNRSNAKKYIVLMTDGEPTFYSYIWDYWKKSFYREINTGSYGYYTNDSNDFNNGLAYSLIMAEKIKEYSVSNYIIGFSDGINNEKLNSISKKSGGIYKEAKDANTINQIYDEIADQIKADFTVEDVKLDFSLPKEINYAGSMDNIEINGTSFTQKIPDIKYVLNDDGTFYEADPFDISITLKATKNLAYDLPLKISYRDINSKIVSKDVANVRIEISNIGTGFDVSRSILENATNTVNLNKEFQMKYRIKPNPINDITGSGVRSKEVVFVLDTSKSMNDTINGEKKIDILKETTKAAIEDLFRNNVNVKVSVVSYNEGSEVKYVSYNGNSKYLIDKSNKEFLESIIDKIEAGEGNQGNGSNGEGSNTGDAIRKSLWVLKYKGNANSEKHIILVGDGKSDRYTYIRSQGRDNLYKELKNDPDGMSDNNSSVKAKYAKDNNGNAYGEAYAQEMATILGNSGVKSYFITMGKDADDKLFDTLSSNAKGVYKNCINANKEEFQQTMLGITDSLKPRYVIKNTRIIENLPQGIVTTNGVNKAEINLPDIVYEYNLGTKRYEAKEITATLGLKGNKIAIYDLNKDAVLRYTDLEQNQKEQYFHPLTITVIDEYILKQGLFTNKATSFGTLGENYLLNDSNEVSEIAEDFTAKVGTYVRTSGQPTRVKIIINKDQNSNIQNINMNSIRLFKVTEKNELEEIKGFNFINDKVLDNYREITVSLPPGDTSKYNHYIINYNFSTTNKSAEGGNINCSAVIEEVGRSNDFILKSVMLPDVF